MKKCIAVLCVLAMASTASAGSYGGTGGVAPDDGYDGTFGPLSMMASSVTAVGELAIVTTVSVDVDISQTWVGDLVIKLKSPSGTVATLLSRPGYIELLDDGTGCCGDSSNWVLGSPQSFIDGGSIPAEDLGLAQPGSDDPIPAQTLNPNDALNAMFAGEGANGPWTLYIGDSAAGDATDMTGGGWTLNLTSEIPEPATLSLLALGGLALIRRRR